MANNNMLGVRIDSILRTFKTEISFYQPLYEAIANSFDANAKNIEIKFERQANLFDIDYIKSIEVIDDGDGFTPENISSFLEYMSDYKMELGCKGVGRFTWLKVFNSVSIQSQSEIESISIKFSKTFDIERDVVVSPNKGKENYTSIKFENIISEKHTRIVADLIDIKKKIVDYFMLKFIGMKNRKESFAIKLICENKSTDITLEDIGELHKQSFSIRSTLIKEEQSFDVYYNLLDSARQTKNECVLCGNGRAVERFDLKKIFSTLPESKHIKVLIYSKYFDDRVNDERTAFTFNKNDNNPSFINPIPFPIISEKIENVLEEIVLKEFPFIIEDNERIIKESIAEMPYLSKYILKDKSVIKKREDLITNAQKAFEKEKEAVKNNFIAILGNQQIDSNELISEFKKLNELSNRELAQYFVFRQTIIDSLKRMNDDAERIEKYLHALFFEMGAKSSKEDPMLDRYSNCVWLLDDKYMSYEKMYSDAKISKIKKEILEDKQSYHGGLEPDLTIFYSNHDVVVVEFKAIGASADDKLTAYTEINRNIGVVAKNFDELNNIYGYVITKFDDNFKDYISEQPGIKTMFSSGKDPIYYLYNDNVKDANGAKKNAYIYFVSTDTIFYDANSRNKMFIDIIHNE